MRDLYLICVREGYTSFNSKVSPSHEPRRIRSLVSGNDADCPAETSSDTAATYAELHATNSKKSWFLIIDNMTFLKFYLILMRIAQYL